MTTETNQAPEVAVKLTYSQKLTAQAKVLFDRITADTNKYNAISAELANISAIESLAEGAAVTVKTGRKFQDKDTTQVRDGVVLGVKTDEAGKRTFKVQVGSGFDADVVVVDGSAITVKPVAAEAEVPAAE